MAQIKGLDTIVNSMLIGMAIGAKIITIKAPIIMYIFSPFFGFLKLLVCNK